MSIENPTLLEGALAPSDNTKLFGHEDAERFLAQSYQSGKGHHAILIEGPQGIGKSTLAFRFANHVLSYPDQSQAPLLMSDPDPSSSINRQIAAGASHNLLYLKKPVDEKTGKLKSAITVEEVRKAGRFFSQTSGTGGWRIVIIDAADDMNRNAANAVLKILEEPPQRSLFFLLSHAPGKLLPTIRSRCSLLKLSPLTKSAMMNALAHLDIHLDDEKSANLLERSNGSVGEALKLLNHGGMDIASAYDEALTLPGPPSRKVMHQLADALSAKNSEIIFDFFVGHVSDDLMKKARETALMGQMDAAARLAEIHSDITERLTVSQAYNLDRKQTIISILEDIRAANTAS